MKKILILIILSSIITCCQQEKSCSFNQDFLKKRNIHRGFPTFSLETFNCKEYLLNAEFYYQTDISKISCALNKVDQQYFLENELVFDFSDEKKHGKLKISDEDFISVKFDRKIYDSFEYEYSLFKLENVFEYDGFPIDLTLIISEEVGIVGEFYSGNDGGILFQNKYRGDVEIKRAIDSIFVERLFM